MSRIAVLRALPGLGDLLCAIPALRALRAARPDAQIDVIGLERTRAIWERYPELLDRVLAFPGWPGLPEEPHDEARTGAFFADAPRYDEAFQLHGSGPESTRFVERLGAARTYAPARWRETRNEVLWPLDVLARAGIAPAGTATTFPFDAASPVGGRYAVVHPGSSLPDRRWPAERFAAVADALGMPVVLTGTAPEADAVRAVEAAMTTEPIDLSERTGLDEMAALLAGAEVVVVNDTGVSHLAAAVGARSVVTFMVTDPRRWAPLDAERHVALVDPTVDEVLRAAAARSPGSGP